MEIKNMVQYLHGINCRLDQGPFIMENMLHMEWMVMEYPTITLQLRIPIGFHMTIIVIRLSEIRPKTC